MNYTKPNDPDHEDNPKEWLNSALIFARALAYTIKPNKGLVIELVGDMYNPVSNSKKVIIINTGRQIVIDPFEQDLPEGTYCDIVKNSDN